MCCLRRTLKRRPSNSAARSRAELPRRAVVLLIGNLGAGKTTLAKGHRQRTGRCRPDEVASPTFTLIHEYGRGGRWHASVYHIDLYRLDRPNKSPRWAWKKSSTATPSC